MLRWGRGTPKPLTYAAGASTKALRGFDGNVHDFYVRQLWDGEAAIDIGRLSPSGLRAYGEACSWTLARGHARSGDRFAMAGYLADKDTFDRAVGEFASAYADVTAKDHRRLLAAIDEKRVPRNSASKRNFRLATSAPAVAATIDRWRLT